MEQFVDDYGVDGFDHIADQGGSIWRAFQVNAQPSFVFIDDNGTLDRHIGGLPIEELAAKLEGLRAS